MVFPSQPLDGFDTPIKLRQFIQSLNECVSARSAIEVEVDPTYSEGDNNGGRWFKDAATGRVWRLIESSPGFDGVWEEVYIA